ncbi:MAG: DNA repair exonuclease [Hydrogenophaga sp.]|uniref:metallophosphoesterase family protein n=1 Tax=Hydrogenophaga sp. TaxID=1904254 RepID=UPI002ABA6E8E|nr:DNA repair exonuclease [Hydrogenophaga sp.]MDZ4190380.1 DNA repair exonuclease [Hydrogenophaga sp.]
MKFIHTADIHLDSPLRGLASYPDAPVDRLRTATRDAFTNLVNLAIEEAVDFMVIAGDVYDGDWKDFNTGLFFIKEMGRLKRADIPVYLLYGNHDADSEMTKSLALPDNVHVFSSRKGDTFQIDALKVALHGRSFKQAATTDSLLPSYPAPVPGWFNIGVLHTALEGNHAHARYAPCTVAELQAKGYQYWALGHVHEHWMLRGDTTIAYPGNLQGRHIRETGPRGALLVEVDGTEITAIERVEVDVLRWHVLNVVIDSAQHFPEALCLTRQGMTKLLETAQSDMPLAIRVVFTGSSAAHAQLVRDEAQLRQELIGQALTLDADRIWIEKVRVESTSPTAAFAATESGGELLADLGVMAQAALTDAEFLASLQGDWSTLLEKIPHEVLTQSEELAGLRDDPVSQLTPRILQATALLMARMAHDVAPTQAQAQSVA